MPQHTTLGDMTQTVKVVSSFWMSSVTILVGILIILVLFLLAVVITNRITLEELATQSEVQRQRNLALDEMLLKRATVQRWTFLQACAYAQSKGQVCPENPQWWADPLRYPALINNESGTGLFPPQGHPESVPIR
jgi:hypothetical protein